MEDGCNREGLVIHKPIPKRNIVNFQTSLKADLTSGNMVGMQNNFNAGALGPVIDSFTSGDIAVPINQLLQFINLQQNINQTPVSKPLSPSMTSSK